MNLFGLTNRYDNELHGDKLYNVKSKTLGQKTQHLESGHSSRSRESPDQDVI